MQERGLLVDFENVQQIDLGCLPPDFKVTIFVGCAQKAIPLELVQAMQCLGDRVAWCRVDGIGSNALDFYIAYYLGCRFAKHPQAQYVILSKDAGFDPLVRHLTSQGLHCKRIADLADLNGPPTAPPSAPLTETTPTPKTVPVTPKPASVKPPAPDPNYERVVTLLTKASKSRPAKRASLTKHVAAMFANKLTAAEVERLVNRLFTDDKVAEVNATLTYKL